MAYNNPSVLVPEQLPEFIASGAPLFVEFMQAYYEFLSGYNYRVEKLRDVDQAVDELVRFLRAEFASKFPTALVDDRKLIPIVRSIYRAKGTINAVELLFRVFLNESIYIQQPGSNILRASDGRWQQDKYITLLQQYGAIDLTNPIQLKISNNSGTFFIDVSKYEVVDPVTIRMYHNSLYDIPYSDTQYVDIVEPTGQITYRGLLIDSPSYIEVITGGTNWKLGQVITLPGSTTPTIARVTRIGPGGVLLAVEIVQYGYTHTKDQITLISPYPNKPVNATYDITSTISGLDAFGDPYYHYTLTLSSYTEGITESSFGLTSASGFNAYFLEDYVEANYVNSIAYQQESTYGTSSDVGIINPDLSVEEWLASRATLVYRFEKTGRIKGEFTGDNGLISNPNIRLQDNYFYQLFSYVIESTRQVNEYRGALNMIHPAGLKVFGELAKTAVIYSDQLQAFRTLSLNTAYARDTIDAFASDPTKFVFKNVTEVVLSSDDITSFVATKSLTETPQSADIIVNKIMQKVTVDAATIIDGISSVVVSKALTDTDTAAAVDGILNRIMQKAALDTASSTDGITSRDTIKSITETPNTTESITSRTVQKTLLDPADVIESTVKSLTRQLQHAATSFEQLETNLTKVTADLVPLPGDTINLGINKLTADSTSASDGSASINILTTTYSAEDYFLEAYTARELQLTIG